MKNDSCGHEFDSRTTLHFFTFLFFVFFSFHFGQSKPGEQRSSDKIYAIDKQYFQGIIHQQMTDVKATIDKKTFAK